MMTREKFNRKEIRKEGKRPPSTKKRAKNFLESPKL
jgi:hypothetical protein